MYRMQDRAEMLIRVLLEIVSRLKMSHAFPINSNWKDTKRCKLISVILTAALYFTSFYFDSWKCQKAFKGYLAQVLLISSCRTYSMPKECVFSLYGNGKIERSSGIYSILNTFQTLYTLEKSSNFQDWTNPVDQTGKIKLQKDIGTEYPFMFMGYGLLEAVNSDESATNCQTRHLEWIKYKKA